MEITMRKFARLAALGALGVAAGSLALYLLIAIGSSSSPGSGIDGTHATLTWISAAIPFAGIIAAHIAYAVQLLRHDREQRSK